MNTIHELFNAKAQYNKWLNELTESEKELIYEMMEETRFKNLDFLKSIPTALDQAAASLEFQAAQKNKLNILVPKLRHFSLKIRSLMN